MYTSPGVDKDFDEDSWWLKGVKGVGAWSRGYARDVPIVSKYYSILYFLVRFWRVFGDRFQMHININAGWHFENGESIQDYENIILTDQGAHR